MLFASFSALLLASTAAAQALTDPTLLVGTWASGSRKVVTGSGFANPADGTFTYPPVGGVSYSFTADGFFETARYRFESNGAEPNCIKAVINWIHGEYQTHDNGSIVLSPYMDGYQQVQDPCAAVSNFVETYNNTEMYSLWQIFLDRATNGYKLHLFEHDGRPVAPQFKESDEPNMLPTQLLRNVTISASNEKSKRSLRFEKRSNGALSSGLTVSSLVVATVLAGVSGILL